MRASATVLASEASEAGASLDVPVLEVSVRGNPLLEIGDAIHIGCPSKKVDFSGIIMRANYSFNGSLSCTLTLLNLDILKDRR